MKSQSAQLLCCTKEQVLWIRPIAPSAVLFGTRRLNEPRKHQKYKQKCKLVFALINITPRKHQKYKEKCRLGFAVIIIQTDFALSKRNSKPGDEIIDFYKP